jgi:hypothetical protein
MTDRLPQQSESKPTQSSAPLEHGGNVEVDMLGEGAREFTGQPKEDSLPVHADPSANHHDSMAEPDHRLTGMRRQIFSVIHDLEQDAASHEATMSPPRKRARHGRDPSRAGEVPTNTSKTSTSAQGILGQSALRSQSTGLDQVPISSSKVGQTASGGTSQGLSNDELLALQRESEWLEEDTSVFERENNAASAFNPSPVSQPLDQGQAPPTNSPSHSQNNQAGELVQALLDRYQSFLHGQNESQSSHASREVSQQQTQQLQRTSQRRHAHGPHELLAYPPNRQQLPAGLSLDQICKDYPNHLWGETLRPFIDANWNARKIWEALRDNAKESASIKRPWNKLEHRLLKEKRRMDEEEGSNSAAHGASLDQANPPANTRSGDEANDALAEVQSKLGVSIPLSAFTGAQSTNPGSSGTSLAGSAQVGGFEANHASREAENCIRELYRLFRVELRTQSRILTNILSSDDPQWQSRSEQERVRLVQQEWIHRARVVEANLAADHDVDMSDVGIEQTSESEMLKRLYTLLKRVSQTSPSSPAFRDPGQDPLPRDEYRILVYREELVMLKAWTADWHEQLEERTTAGKQVMRPPLQERFPDTEQRHDAAGGQGTFHHHYAHAPRYSLAQAYAVSSDITGARSYGRVGGSVGGTQSSYSFGNQSRVTSAGYHDPSQSQLTYTSTTSTTTLTTNIPPTHEAMHGSPAQAPVPAPAPAAETHSPAFEPASDFSYETLLYHDDHTDKSPDSNLQNQQ